jgi:hypothetical protein
MSTKVENAEARMAELEARVAALEAKVLKPKAETREMTADDARRVLYGDLKEKSHKEAAAELGLSYGQIYSCRLEFTFKPIHKEMAEAGQKNRWTVKK